MGYGKTVYLTTNSGRDVYFARHGESVWVGNSGETLRVTRNIGDPIYVTNPEVLTGEIKQMWEDAIR